MKALKVKHAFLHQSVSIPGFLNTERTLSAQKTPGVEMTLVPQGLLLQVMSKTKKTACAIIPHANVAVAILDEEYEIEDSLPVRQTSRTAKA